MRTRARRAFEWMLEHPIRTSLIVALVIRVGLLLFYRGGGLLSNSVLPPGGDQDEYLDLARNLLDGHGYSSLSGKRGAPGPYIYRPPGYAFFLAGGLAVFRGNLALVRVLQTLLTAGFAFSGFVGARALTDDKRLVLATCLVVAVNPFLVYFSFFFLSEALFYLMLSAAAASALWLAEREPDSMKAALRTGALFAVASLFRGEAWYYAWAVLGLFLVRRSKIPLKTTAAVAGALVLVMSPWIIRNFVVFGRFIPVQADTAALSMIYANAPSYNGAPWPGYEEWKTAVLAKGEALPETSREQFLMKELRSYYVENWSSFLRTALHKLRHFYSLVPATEKTNGGDATPYQGRSFMLLSLVGFGAFFPLSIVGMFRVFTRREVAGQVLGVMVLANMGIGAIANNDIRLRSQMQFNLILLALIGVVWLLTIIAVRRAKRLESSTPVNAEE